MNVVITGGAGFLGQRLARKLLARGTLSSASGGQEPIERLVLADVVPAPDFGDERVRVRSEEHTSELQSRRDLVCRLLLEKKKKKKKKIVIFKQHVKMKDE